MVVVAPPCFEIAPELVGKPPREILFLAPPAMPRELIKQFLALCVLGRLRASLRLLLGDALHPLGLISRWRRRRRDHVASISRTFAKALTAPSMRRPARATLLS